MAKKTPKFSDTSKEQPQDSSNLKNPEEVDARNKDALTNDDKDNISAQVKREIEFSRRYKQGKIRNWQKNEEMYYAKKLTATESRSNIELGRMPEHVHTILAEIDDPLMFRFAKRKESQLRRVNRLNSLRTWDSMRDEIPWDISDIAMKKQCIIYGRTAAVYYADSIDGKYKPHLEPIDVYDLLVDPDGGGVNVEQMLYWGRYGVVKSKDQLQAMSDEEKDQYFKKTLDDLIAGSGNNTESTQEETNKFIRMYGQNTIGKKALQTDEKYKFWQWFTTYKGKRYVVVYHSTAGRAISICPLTELFQSGLWPLWTYAAFMDLTEFWTPSYCDYVREIFMNQNVTINQMNDNAEAINKPMKVVNVTAIENLAELKYRRDGIIKTKGDYDANKAVQILQTPSINTPLLVYDKLEAIVEKASGVTETEKGTEDADGAVEIYKGNRKASAGRYGLFNKSYSFGYNRFALLYQWGVREHLIKKEAVEVLGPNGVETESFSRKDIFRKNDDFRVIVESANADKLKDANANEAKIELLTDQVTLEAKTQQKVVNPQKAFELKARIAGFTDDEIKELMDIDDYGNEDLMSQCAEDIEDIINGEAIKPNPAANNAYKQKIVDYMKAHMEDLTEKQWKDLTDYVKSLQQIIYGNEARSLLQYKNQLMNKNTAAIAANPPTGTSAGATSEPAAPDQGGELPNNPLPQ